MDFLTFLQNNIVILDGSMGTLLQEKGYFCSPEKLNIEAPEIIKDIHKSYFDAGSNVITTNTFGANVLKYEEFELEEIIKSAVKIAKEAREESSSQKEKFIALDMGPTGKLLKPLGDLHFEDAVNVFKKTVSLAVKYGVDLVLIETMNDSLETKAALLAVKESCDLPVIVTNAYNEDGKLMTGATPEAMCAMLEGMGACALGANCSLGPNQLKSVIEKLLSCASIPVVFKPNAGLPKEVNKKTVFDITAEEFASLVADLIKKGVHVAGGCCGTTPEYISLLCEKTKNLKTVEIIEKNKTVVSSYTHAVEFDKPLLIGERINPTGKKRFKQALIENDINYILNEGILQSEKGVHILDVNVGLPDIDEKTVLTNAVYELQAVTDKPLQIDTSDYVAMEKALRIYNGKAMINSVNGKKESMENIFPLVKKYGGVVVALTLDESGIPETAEGRVEIARKILKEAEKYGINKKDIVFDALTLTVSADKNSAITTLNALEIIKNDLKCHTVLGVSNVSFGLPEREKINSTFFALALQKGLSAAIMNPYSSMMMDAYFSFLALSGLDENFENYIEKVEKSVKEVKTEALDTLESAITKGLKEKAEEITKTLLLTEDPLKIVNEKIIPALNIVGEGFENKKVYLPQLLMSAESAKSAFEVIKTRFSQKGGKGKFVLATVEGDIHDIGKNIVKLLLENYGFQVYDLGKDVKPETIVNAVKETGARLVGLSALMTTTVPKMEETILLLRKEAPETKVIVGGAVLNEDYAKKIGADKYAKDAMEAVRCAEEFIKN